MILAKVASVYSAGISLYMPGSTEPTNKRYKKLDGCPSLSPGDKVMIEKTSGTYVIVDKVAGGSQPGPIPEVYSFTIDGETYHFDDDYNNWGLWLESPYNTKGWTYYVSEMSTRTYYLLSLSSLVAPSKNVVCGSKYSTQSTVSWSKITANYEYTTK